MFYITYYKNACPISPNNLPVYENEKVWGNKVGGLHPHPNEPLLKSVIKDSIKSAILHACQSQDFIH